MPAASPRTAVGSGTGTPTAYRVALLIAYTVPSGPIAVGVYASPIPTVRATTSVNVLVVRSQRYSLPSALLARTLLVAGSIAAVLMHHSRTASG